MPVQFGRLEIQFAVRDAVKDKSGVLCECMELRSSSPSWPRSMMMLDEQGASRRGSPGVGSPATGRHLKPRHRKIPVSEHRSRTREHKLVHYTHRPIPDVVRRSRGPFTHLCRAERECKSAKVTLSPARTTVLSFRCWSERKVVLDCLYHRGFVIRPLGGCYQTTGGLLSAG